MMTFFDELQKETAGYVQRLEQARKVQEEEEKKALQEQINANKDFYGARYFKSSTMAAANHGKNVVTIVLYSHRYGLDPPAWFPAVREHIEHVLHEMDIPETNYEFGTRNEEGTLPVQIIGYLKIWW